MILPEAKSGRARRVRIALSVSVAAVVLAPLVYPFGLKPGVQHEIVSLGGAIMYPAYVSTNIPPVHDSSGSWLSSLRVLYKPVDGIDFSSARVTDETLPDLSLLEPITVLDLSNTQVHGKSLKRLAAIEGLESLNLTGCDIDDDDVRELQACKCIEFLALDYTNVSNIGLKHLADIKTLRKVLCRHTQVSAAGVAEAKAINPSLYVVFESPL